MERPTRTPGGAKNEKSGKDWSKEELREVLEFYLYELKDGKGIHESNPVLIKAAKKLGRETRTFENQSYLSKCSVTEEHLVFTTDRNSDLLFSFRRYGGSNSVFSIYLDEVYISGFGIGGDTMNGFGAAYSFVVPNVPVGNHRMSWVTELRGLGPQSLGPGQVFVSQATFDVKATYISSN